MFSFQVIHLGMHSCEEGEGPPSSHLTSKGTPSHPGCLAAGPVQNLQGTGVDVGTVTDYVHHRSLKQLKYFPVLCFQQN